MRVFNTMDPGPSGRRRSGPAIPNGGPALPGVSTRVDTPRRRRAVEDADGLPAGTHAGRSGPAALLAALILRMSGADDPRRPGRYVDVAV